MPTRQKANASEIMSERKPASARRRGIGRRSMQSLRLQPLQEPVQQSAPRPAAHIRSKPALVGDAPVNYHSLAEIHALRTRQVEPAHIPTPPASLSRTGATRAASEASEYVSEVDIAAERAMVRYAQNIQLFNPALTHSTARLVSARRSPGALARLRALVESFVRRILSMLRGKTPDQRTARGRAALEQLQALYNLICPDDDEGMDLVQRQVLFGEAYYSVLQASREHFRRHKGKEPENYQSYFEDFLRKMP